MSTCYECPHREFEECIFQKVDLMFGKQEGYAQIVSSLDRIYSVNGYLFACDQPEQEKVEKRNW